MFVFSIISSELVCQTKTTETEAKIAIGGDQIIHEPLKRHVKTKKVRFSEKKRNKETKKQYQVENRIFVALLTEDKLK